MIPATVSQARLESLDAGVLRGDFIPHSQGIGGIDFFILVEGQFGENTKIVYELRVTQCVRCRMRYA